MDNEKDNVLESFISLGLKTNEAKVYLATLKMGQATVGEIADSTDVQRTFIYDILEELHDKGLISQVDIGKVKHFSALSVEKFKNYQEEKLAKFALVLPELKALEKSVGDRPRVQFFEGIDGIKMALEDTLKQPKGSKILAYATGVGAYEQMPEFLSKYFKKRVEKKITMHCLAPDNTVNREHIKHDKAVLRETILLPEKKFPFTNEIDIYGNKVAIMSLQGEILAVIIESESVAKTQRAIFELAWLGAEKYKTND